MYTEKKVIVIVTKKRELFTNSRFSLDNFVKIAKCNNFLIR